MHLSTSSLTFSSILFITTLAAPLATDDFSQFSPNRLDLTSIITSPNGQGHDNVQFVVTHAGSTASAPTSSSLCIGEASMTSKSLPASGTLTCQDGAMVEFVMEKKHGDVMAKCTIPGHEDESVAWTMVERSCVRKRHGGVECSYMNAGDLKVTNSTG
ncbi:hypothetical protein BGZ60DRAFT_434152 [Tricladium varicosporioides]|nr:hypothetical protein BGZ60DRAFT_434152 [Hymenoscyphus varicosporioides]